MRIAVLCAALAACGRVSESPIPNAAADASSPRGAGGSSYRVLYSFAPPWKRGDGARPMGKLHTIGANLYGTTDVGGTSNAQCTLGCGTVFTVDTAGKERVIYRFAGGSKGAGPLAALTYDTELFGTTTSGGSSACSGGCGTVFKLTTDGKPEMVLHRFTGGTDGANPVAGMVLVGTTFYGTTPYGGMTTNLCSNGCGTVFAVTASGSERIIYRFKGGSDGATPIDSLYVFDGNLYGTTEYGGSSTNFCETGCGTVFEMSTSGVKKTLYSFRYSSKSADSAYPAAGLVALNGELYGTTIGGGKYSDGTVFAVDPTTGSEKVLHSFDCCSTVLDGEFPVAPLVAVDGILYGTTRNGGTNLRGTVFEIRTSGLETVLHDFTGSPDGDAPTAGLAPIGGVLYGTTADGGSRSEGTVFALKP
jgi:uncharacterized repeat protein (TIGR03803 family)